MLLTSAIIMFSYCEAAWDDRAAITLDLAAYEDATWAALVSDLVAIGAT